MTKSSTCPEYTPQNAKSIILLFTECYDPRFNSIDVSTAVSRWWLDNYNLVSDNDFRIFARIGYGDAFRLFVDTLVQTYGYQHIMAAPRFTVGIAFQSRMTLVRKQPKQAPARNYAWNRLENQLNYIKI